MINTTEKISRSMWNKTYTKKPIMFFKKSKTQEEL